MKNNDNHLRLFVYGTLKKGFWNFDRFCTRSISIEPATTWGRLYHLSAGFPAIEIPDCRILAHGSPDPLADTQLQNNVELLGTAMDRPDGDWDIIYGELITFNDPRFDLPPIDRLEGFNPNGHSMYKRVLTNATRQDDQYTCWIYFGLEHILREGVRLPDGIWDGHKLR